MWTNKKTTVRNRYHVPSEQWLRWSLDARRTWIAVYEDTLVLVNVLYPCKQPFRKIAKREIAWFAASVAARVVNGVRE